MDIKVRSFSIVIVLVFLASSGTSTSLSYDSKNLPLIKTITVEGNNHTTDDAILNKLPFKQNTPFDQQRSAEAIHNLYSLDLFEQVTIEKEHISPLVVDLFVIVSEKKILEKIEFVGNKSIKRKKLLEKTNLDKKEMINDEELKHYIKTFKESYRDEGYHFVSINAKLVPNQENPDKVIAQFEFNENVKSYITRINFKGNKTFDDRKLRSILLTRERWLISILDGSGKYNPEMLEVDKRLIERLYQNEGYLLAKVSDADVEFSKTNEEIIVTFTIIEGQQFVVKNIYAPGDDVFLEKDILPHILLEKNKPYAVNKVISSMEKLKELWGEKGYINVDVYPQPKPDEKTGTVDVTFYVERGDRVYVNRIDITGNEATRDKLIRRQIELEEGDLITARKLDSSRTSIERLSFFERGGVNWRMHRIDDETADIEMNVKETQTGQLNFKASLGSEEHSNKRAVRVGIDLDKRNFMGEGWDLGGQANLQLAKKGSQFFEGHIFDPYLFDSNVSANFSIYRRKQDFSEWHNVTRPPSITEWGGVINLGFALPQIDKDLVAGFEVGLEDMKSNVIEARGNTIKERAGLQAILDRSFQSTTLQWFNFYLSLDTRNHRIYPSRGYRLYQSNKLAVPGINNTYAFIKSEFETSYYTPLIGEDSLVLALRTKFGAVQRLNSPTKSLEIPYKELFHMGGQSTVRGFSFGSIGPAWKNVDPLGAKYAIQLNAELIFPLLPDYSMKGHVFYDAGAGWDTPTRGTSRRDLIVRNDFNMRHSIGFGLNLIHPQPIKIDWGYKLDRNKKVGESGHEFHLQANMAF
jgi:outer membrane protein insertion porin family